MNEKRAWRHIHFNVPIVLVDNFDDFLTDNFPEKNRTDAVKTLMRGVLKHKEWLE